MLALAALGAALALATQPLRQPPLQQPPPQPHWEWSWRTVSTWAMPGFTTATEQAVEGLCRLDCLTPAQKEQLRLPLRQGGLGLRSQASLRDVAYLGSWLGNLEGVRERCPAGTASKERFATGDRAWARALTDAVAGLAADGVHLNDEGAVKLAPPPATPGLGRRALPPCPSRSARSHGPWRTSAAPGS